MNLVCRLARLQMPTLNVDSAGRSGPLAAHVDLCLSCQAEAARYRKLLRAMAGLSDDFMEAPYGLVEAVDARIDEAGVPSSASSSGRGARVVAAAGAAVAAAGTVVVVRWLRTRAAA